MQSTTFETEDGLTLEGEIRAPDGPPIGSAVLCHPHPQYGGSKDHPLLWAIRMELANIGFTVLSFNFRGVMGSEGSFGGGREEMKDVRAAVGRARDEDPGPTFVCGWSFGAYVALQTALDDDRMAALALVALPLRERTADLPILPDLADPERLSRYDRPVLLLGGDSDPFCPIPELLVMAGRLPGSSVEIVAQADHYFRKREREAARIVAAFAADAVKEGSGRQ
jgi:alpha/beta superfamily hydrolase